LAKCAVVVEYCPKSKHKMYIATSARRVALQHFSYGCGYYVDRVRRNFRTKTGVRSASYSGTEKECNQYDTWMIYTPQHSIEYR